MACGACRGLPSPGEGGPSRRGPCLVQQPDPSHPWGLQVMESVVKNCGQTVHDEVANKQTMEELKELLKVGTPWRGGSLRHANPDLVVCGARAAGPSSCRVGEGVQGQGWELRLEGRDTDMGGKGSEWEARESNTSTEGQWGDSRAGTLGEWASCPPPAEAEKAS